LAAGGLLGVGENVFAVQASDKEGNVTFLEWRFTIVTDPPSKPVFDAVSEYTNTKSARLAGAVSGIVGSGSVTVDLTVNGVPAGVSLIDTASISSGTGRFAFTNVPLREGVNTIIARAQDSAGNVSDRSDTLSLSLDTVAPTVRLRVVSPSTPGILQPLPAITSKPELALVGTVSDNTGLPPAKIELIVNGSPVAVTPVAPQVNTTVTLVEGQNLLQLVATDAAGNIGSGSEWKVVLDTTPPSIAPGAFTALPSLVAGQVQLRWEGDSARDIASVRVYRTEGGAPIRDASALTPIASVPLSQAASYVDRVTEGVTYTYALTGVDSAGNEAKSIVSRSQNVTVLSAIGGDARYARLDGSRVTVRVPADALFTNRTLRALVAIEPADLAALPALTVNSTPVVEGAFAINARLSSGALVGSQNPNGGFLSPATLIIPVLPELLTAEHLPTVYQWSAAESQWRSLTTVVDAAAGVVTAAIPSSGVYQLVDLTRDTVLPTIADLKPASGTVIETLLPTLTATVTDDSELRGVRFVVVENGTDRAITGTPTVTPSPTSSKMHLVSFTLPAGTLSDGKTFELAILVEDLFGNIGRASTSVEVKLPDSQPPVVLSAKPGYPNAEADTIKTLLPTIEIVLRDEKSSVGSVRFLVDGAELPMAPMISQVDVDGKSATRAAVTFPLEYWTAEKAMASGGKHTIEARFTDSIGNAGTLSWSVIAAISDTVAPKLERVTVADIATLTPDLALVITEAASKPVTLIRATVDGASVPVASLSPKATADGIALKVPEGVLLVEGAHEFRFALADAIGNVGSGSSTVTITLVDRIPPTILGFLPDGVTDTLTPDLLIAYEEARSEPIRVASLSINGQKVDLTTVSPVVESGLVTVSVPQGLLRSAGKVDVAMTIEDAAGNPATQAWTFNIVLGDAEAPRVLNVLLNGQVAPGSDGLVRSLTPTIELRLSEPDALASLQLTINDKPLTAGQLAGLSLLPPDEALPSRAVLPLSAGVLPDEGTYTLKALLQDAAGNQAAWEYVLRVRFPDASAPNVLSFSPTGLINSTTPTVRLDASETGGISAVTVLVDGKPVAANVNIGTVANPKVDPWPVSFQIPSGVLSPVGAHTVEVTLTDLDGNRAGLQWKLNVDSVAPRVLLQLPADKSKLVVGRPDLNVLFAEDSGLKQAEFFLNNASIGSVDGSKVAGNFVTLRVPNALRDGDYQVVARLTDLAGNATEARWGFSILRDTVAPVVTRQLPTPDSAIELSRPKILAELSDQGSALDLLSLKLFVDDQRVRPSIQDGKVVTFVPETELKLGDHRVRVEVADVAGNVTTQSWTFRYEAAPWVAETYPQDGTQLGLQPRIGFRFADDFSGVDSSAIQVSVRRNGREVPGTLQVAPASGGGVLSAPQAPLMSMVTPTEVWFTPSDRSGLKPGVYIVEGRVRDNAGLETVTRWSFSVAEAALMSAPRILGQGVPTGDEGRIEFFVAQAATVEVMFFTVDGQLLGSERQDVPAAAGMTRVSVPLSGRNALGERLATGMHIGVVQVRAGDRVERRTVKFLVR
ncbi:hypothetical protein FJZ36_17000, partial [Candidatus Poribacteria bacterium]|nr:hypothetical protein [Candidatus Poribacteria bacterium]